MLDKLIKWIRGVINKMFNKSELKRHFNVSVNISDKMAENIELWNKLFENQAPWLSDTVKSLNLAASIANEVARLVTLELESEITGSKRADYLNEIYQTFLSNIESDTEYACAGGGTIFKPYVKNNTIAIETVQATRFTPTEFDTTGKLIGAIFAVQKIIGSTYYTRLEYQRFENKEYVIDNLAFKSTNKEVLGEQILLTDVDEWANISPRVSIKDLEKPLFSYFKMPFANQIERSSHLGVSIYSRAIDLIKEADKQYSRILWEYEGSELAIDADVTALTTNKATQKLGLPSLNNRLFRNVGMQNKDGNFYNVFSPTIRDESLFNGLDKLLKKIEFVCGLAYGTISDPANVDKTATEIKQSKQRSYATVCKIQSALQTALEDLIYALDSLASLYGLAPVGNYETSYKWDDSIIVDADEERERDLQDVRMGIMSKEEFRAKWYGETIEQARQNLPKEADVIE